jgi:hypothetical protein
VGHTTPIGDARPTGQTSPTGDLHLQDNPYKGDLDALRKDIDTLKREIRELKSLPWWQRIFVDPWGSKLDSLEENLKWREDLLQKLTGG